MAPTGDGTFNFIFDSVWGTTSDDEWLWSVFSGWRLSKETTVSFPISTSVPRLETPTLVSFPMSTFGWRLETPTSSSSRAFDFIFCSFGTFAMSNCDLRLLFPDEVFGFLFWQLVPLFSPLFITMWILSSI